MRKEEPAEPASVPLDNPDEGRGSDTPSEARASRLTRKKKLAAEKMTVRKFSIPASVYRRLSLLTVERDCSASAIVAELLDRHLPRYDPLKRTA